MSATANGGRRSVGWVILFVSAVLALLGTALWLVLDSRESGAAGTAGGDVVLAQADDEDEGETDDEVALATISVTYDFFLSRDPFESIRPPEPVAAPTDPTDPTQPTDPTDPTQPTQPTQPTDPTDPTQPTDPSTPPGDGACVTGAEAVCDGIVVSLRGVTATTATVQVGGVDYEVEPGDVFATNFQLIRISGDCVDILYMNGDEADMFRLCDGDSISK